MPHLGPCWIWTGGRNDKGYGQIGIDGRTEFAHRVAWEMTNGPIPGDKPCVLHHCDTPLCVNVAHLFTGTKANNTADMHAKNRHPFKLPTAVVLEIQRRCAEGERKRDIAADLNIHPSSVWRTVRRLAA